MGIFLCELIAHRLAGLAAYKFNQQRAGIRLLMHAQCRERQHGADGNAQEAATARIDGRAYANGGSA